jgi:hypothetical protein
MSNESACTCVSQRLPTSPPAMGKNCAHGHYQSKRTHANLFFASADKNDQRHPTFSQPGTGLYDCVTRPLNLRNWNLQWDHGIKDASTKCGTQHLTPTAALSICGSTDASDCMHERRPRNHNQYRYVQQLHHSTGPLKCIPISGQFHSGTFHTSAYAPMTKPRATILEHVLER